MDLSTQRYVVFGVANSASICWAIARYLLSCKAQLVLVCQEHFKERVRKLVEESGHKDIAIYTCDVSKEDELGRCFGQLQEHAVPDGYSGFVHGIAYSDPAQLRGRFIDVTRENFLRTMEVSCYSFIDLVRRFTPMMKNGAGSAVTLTFDAARRPYPHYNAMAVAKAALEASVRGCAFDWGEYGMRVNAVSASPERTLSARGIGNFDLIGKFAEAKSLMGRRATIEEIAQTVAFLLSPLGSGITGQVVNVDCGSSVAEMPPARNARGMADAMAAVANVYEKKQEQ